MFSFEDFVSTEIGNFDMHTSIKEAVLNFQVAMCDSCLVQRLDTIQNLPEKLTTNIW